MLFSAQNILLFISAVIYVVAIFLAYVLTRKRVTNFTPRSKRIFFSFVISSFAWFLFNTLSIRATYSTELTILGIRGTLAVTAVVVPLIILFFNNLFEEQTVIKAKLEKLLIPISIVIALSTFLSTTVSSVAISRTGSVSPTFGPTFVFFVAWILFTVFLAARTIWELRKNKSLSHQNKWLFVFWGFLLTITLVIITNLAFVVILNSDQGILLGPSTLLVFIYICLYTVDTSRIIDIRYALDVARRYMLVIVLFVFATLAGNYLLLSTPRYYILISIVLALLLFSGIRTFSGYLEPTAKYSKEIKDFINKLSVELDIDTILNNIAKILTLTMQTQSVAFLVVKRDKKHVSYKFYEGKRRLKNESFENIFDRTLDVWTRMHSQVVVTQGDLRNFLLQNDDVKYKLLLDEMAKSHDIELVAPLNRRVTLNGIVMLGPKKQGIEYTKNDIDILEEVLQFSSVAISRALLYQETTTFALELSSQVKLRTKDLEEARSDLQSKNLQIQNAYHELKTLDDAKSEFISIASHQLRTPISIIKGYLSMISENDFGALTPDQSKVIDKTTENIQQLNDIVDDILNASRIERGKLAIDPVSTDIIDLINSVVIQMQGKAKQRNLGLSFDTKLSKLEIIADRNKIYEVVMNLVDNALSYTQKGEVTITCTTTAKQEDLLITVKDTGIGIPRDFQDKIFKRFSRSANARTVRPDGTGIGLYVVKAFVEAHKGSIWFESILNRGTTFYVKLLKDPKLDSDLPPKA